jgi:hypothetical protein
MGGIILVTPIEMAILPLGLPMISIFWGVAANEPSVVSGIEGSWVDMIGRKFNERQRENPTGDTANS